MEPIVYYRQQKLIVMQATFVTIALALGIWLTFFFKVHNYAATYAFQGLGVFVLLLCVFSLVTMIRVLRDPKEILIIDENGIVDRTVNHKIPIIKWEDIKGIREEVITVRKAVRIDVRNHEDFIKQGKSAINRRLMKNNMKAFGSPFVIHARMVGVRHDELIEQMRHAFKEMQERNTKTESIETAVEN